MYLLASDPRLTSSIHVHEINGGQKIEKTAASSFYVEMAREGWDPRLCTCGVCVLHTLENLSLPGTV